MLLFGCQSPSEPPAPQPPVIKAAAGPKPATKVTPPLKSPPKPKTRLHSELLTQATERVVRFEKHVKAQRTWTRLERLANASMRRARLSGDWNDYQRAQDALDEAFLIAPAPSGPHMTRARLNLTLHRLPQAKTDLDSFAKRPLHKAHTRAAIASMRGDIAVQSGQHEQARRLYSEAIGLSPKATSAHAGLALLNAHHGDFEAAEAGLREAIGHLSKVDALGRAWFHLHLGLLDLERNRLDDAMAHYKEADGVLQGWWLIQEHMAEIHALQGRHDKAQAMYRDLVERTQSPEFMAALGESLQATGDAKGAQRWFKLATARHEALLKRFPEAAAGHALDHFLSQEPDSERTLALAKENHALRPGAEAAILLARAHMARRQWALAQKLLDGVLASGWKTPDALVSAAELAQVQQNTTRAAELCQQANAISPQSCALKVTPEP